MNASATQPRHDVHAIAARLAKLPADKQAIFLRRLVDQGVSLARLPVVTLPHGGNPPLSFAQSRLWFLWKLDPRSPAYNLHQSFRLCGELDRAALEHAFSELACRHEQLRASFREVGDEPCLCVAEPAPLAIPLSNIADLPAENREQAALVAVEAEAEAPFDLSTGPLLRVRLLRLDEREHLLSVTMHHIIADAWSMELAVGELAVLYAAYRAGSSVPLRPLPVRYVDHAVWQRRLAEAGETARQLAYWREKLAGETPALELPLDFPRPALRNGHGASLSCHLDQPLADALRRQATAHGASLFMLLLAAFKVLLYRYTGQGNIRVGVPIANRNRTETEGIVGLFVNTQVLCSDVEGGLGFDALLASVRRTAIEAQDHQDLPFEQLVEALQPERSLSSTPLFQVMYNHLREPADAAPALPGLTLVPIERELRAVFFDLALDTAEIATGELLVSFAYATDLFRRTTIERMRDHFVTLLRHVAHTPATSIADLPLLTPAERRQLTAWNQDAATYPPLPCAHLTLAAQAERRRDEPALFCGTAMLTHGELQDHANRLAHHLVVHGVCPEVRVGVALERSIDLVVSLLAILKAGGTYVPLDPDYPAERLSYMIADAGIALLVTHRHLGERCAIPEGLATLDLGAVDLATGLCDAPMVELHPESLAYLVYTSGSTGRPKGVAVSHGALAMHCHSIGARYEMSPADRELIFMSFSFDGAHERWLTALTHGGSVVIREPELWTPEQTLAALHRYGVTVTALPPAYLQQLAEIAERQVSPPPVRVYCFAGDAVPSASFEQVKRVLRPRWIINGYGPTETVVTPLIWKVGPDSTCDAAYAPIGDRVGARSAWVLDADLNPTPTGVGGELYLGGLGVARGYHDRPALTAERFVPDPFGDGGRLYRSGDLVRQRLDGLIDYLGRIDHQVKIRGFRIELGEIEACLAAHAEVREALVVAHEAPAVRQLVAYVAGDRPELAAELRGYLKCRVPDYMVPAQILVLDRLPVSANGKLDRNALPEPQWRSRNEVSPRTATERALAAIWQEVLDVERVGAKDDFFELGGHSLLALRVVSSIQAELGLPVEMRTLFEAPTLEELAAALETLAPHAKVLPLVRRAVNGEAQPSFAQSRLWFLWQLDRSNAAYNIPLALRLRGHLRPDLLAQALTDLLARHEILRTTFTYRDGQLVQRIHSPRPQHLPVADLTAFPAPEAHARQLAEAEATTPFDLEAGPLLRARLLRLGSDEHVLLMTLHHIVTDGWSMGVLIEEVSATYDALSHGRQVTLPELPIQYADYAEWQRAWLADGEEERQLAYWTAQLGNSDAVLELPTDRPRPTEQSFLGAQITFALPANLVRRLDALARQQHATPFMVLLAAFKALLYRWSGQDDLRVGVPVANRGRPETERLIGLLVNTQVLRTQVDGRQGFTNLLEQVRDAALGAQAHQDLPFERLVEAMRPERSLSHNPLFQVMFSHEPRERAAHSMAELLIEEFGVTTTTSQFDLSLTTEELAGGGVVCRLSYARALFTPATIERLRAHFLTLLAGLLADPAQPLDSLTLLAPAERRQLVRGWNDTATAYDTGLDLLARLRRQAQATPEATALVAGAERLSYRELHARADHLAHWLRARGIGPESLVGLAAERSTAMVVGLLAILEAGAAYLPLDPDLPARRLADMIAQSGTRLVLAQTHLLPRLPELEVEIACLEHAPGQAAPAAAAPPPPHPDSLAYCIFTSGSTGRPKGVGNSHAGLLNRLLWMQARYRLGPDDRVLQKTPFSFDVSVWEFLWPLITGATLVMAPPGAHRDPASLRELIVREGVTTLHFVPSMLQAFLAAGELPACTSLRRVICSGEALPAGLQRQFLARHPAGLHNLYGPTEAAIDVTAWDCREAPEAATVPIGRPIANIQIHLLDAGLEPVPVGVLGELAIGGIGLARGYLGGPGLTAERFVPDPFGDGARLYRTGDLARRRPDGVIEYAGRRDHQVKIRGLRIELGEIEACLMAHPRVREAVVVAQASPGGRQLVAYLTGTAAPEQLKDHLRASLPDYMIPAHLLRLDALPLSPNGKIDRSRLPAPEIHAPAHEPPVGEIEIRLCQAWQEVLGREQVGATDNFFELGGDSIVSIQLVSRARQLGLELAPRDIFRHQTVRALATVARQKITAAQRPEMPTSSLDLAFFADRLPVPPETVEDAYPLSPMQAGMLFHTLEDSEGGTGLYINQMSVDVTGLDTDRFASAWQAAVDRHAVLRTGFIWEGAADPFQFVLQHAELPVREIDWHHREVTPAILAELAAGEQTRGFDLKRPPLMRLLLVRLAGDRCRMIWTYHHVLIDGWSTSQLVGDVLRHYRGEVSEPAGRYRDYIDWLQRQDAEATRQFWCRRLAALEEPTSLASAMPPGARGQGHAAIYTRWSQERTAPLVAFAQRQRITINTLVQGAWLLLLRRCTGQRTVAFGATVSGRPADLADAGSMVGLFINTLPVIQTLHPAQPVGDWLRVLQEENLALREHEHAPLQDINRWAGQPGRGLFDSIIVFENQPIDRTLRHWDDRTLRFTDAADRGVTNFPMDLMVTLEVGGLEIEYMFLRSSFDEPGVERLRSHMDWLLEQLVADADCPVGQLGLARPTERRWLDRLNARVPAAKDELPVHRLIARQAAAQPRAPALRCGDATLSFGELDARADELARHLAGLGVGPDILVGVAMRRSPELLVGFLAILKAGGAYVPIDADYPTERIAYMLKDANLALVLTDSTMRNRLPLPDGVQAIEIDRLEPAEFVTASVWPALHPGNLAYLIYTSGSTGRPKGVAVSHGALAMHVCAIGARYRMSPRDCELIFMSFAFDGAHERWLTALAHGASVAIRDDSLWTPEQTLAALHRHGVTVAAFPPAYLLQLAEHVERSGTPPPVRTYCFGGDAVPQASFELVQRVLRPEAIVNGYGPTETVVTPMIWHAGSKDHCGAVYAPIGDRVGARSVWVLDEDLNPLPPGLAGELYLGGEGLARGYHGRPALTAERFVPDLFDAGGGRLYRTGDLVRQRPDGLIDYLGRIDQQVKIRGFRIELGEIEARLAEHAGVREALVVARDSAAGKQLVAYVTGDGRDLANRLRGWLKERLPDYMVPARILILDQMPVNANGKLDRNALPDPGQQQRDHVLPRTATERALAAIWQEVLGVERIGITDNFFEMGGDSIMTLKVIARLRGQPELGLNLKLRDLMLKPTIAQLCTGQTTAPVKVGPDPLLTLNRAPAGRRPLFCLHAGFGTVFDYDTLARRLEGEVPVHGLQCRMLLDPAWRDHSIAAMARDYARRIREQQRHGPYRLLGWSLGGSLAIAVAHELEAASQMVELCGIVDPFVPGEPAPEVAWLDELAAFLEFTVPQAGVPDPALLGGLHDAGDLPALQELIEQHVAGSPAASPDTEELAQLFAVGGRLRMLAEAMPPLPTVTVAPISFWLPGRAAARRQFCEQIGRQGEMHEVDSTHFYILREPALVDVVAQALAATLAPS